MSQRSIEDHSSRDQVGRWLLERSHECLMLLDRDARLQFVSAECNRQFEIDDFEPLRGRPWWDLWPESALPFLRQAFAEAAAGRTAHFQQAAPTLNGAVKNWIVTLTPISSGGDPASPQRIIASCHDADEQVKSADALKRLADIVSGSQDAIISKDLNGIVKTWNEAASRIFGYSPAEAIGRSIRMLIPEALQAEESEILLRIRNGDRVAHYDTVRVHKNGQLIDVSLTVSPIVATDGTVVGASKIVRDITEMRHMEQALRQTDQRKDEFLATLAHELRNPLAPLRMGLTLLRRQGVQSPATEQTHAMMERQLKQMSRLIEDLMDVSRISTGRLELRTEPLAVNTIINLAIETSQPLIESRGHELRAMLPANSPLVHGDATRLAQVFVNLLNNASKYTPKGGHIDIDIASHGGELMVSVRDDGIGIAPDELPRIFELFAQSGRAPDSAPTGLGIGLSLVKKVVELHGGSVAARSAGLGRGAVVEVRLPVVQATDAPALQVPPSADPRLIEPRRVLVVDDNRDIADSLATILSTMGFDTKVAYDGEQASKVVETFQPHAAVLDIGLPKLDGNELCRFIRRQHWGKDATVIAVTGLGQPADRLKSQEAGFNHYFVKPIDPQNIVDILPANR